MKKKCVVVTLIMIMVLSMFSGCGKDNKSASDSNTIYGEVSKIENDVITIKVGTMNKMERTSNKDRGGEKRKNINDSSDGNENQLGKRDFQGENKDGNRPDMLDMTGEEQEIKVTDSTVITRNQRGGKMGNPPEMPSGEQQGEDNQGNPPEMPEGESMKQLEAEEITLENISEGDIVAITLDNDGNAKEIAVITMGGGMGQPDDNQNGENMASGASAATSWSDYKVEKLY